MEAKGFLATIFDFSFTEFVTTKVIKFLLGLAMVVNVIVTIFWIVGGFNISALMGILFIVLSPVIYLILMLFSRIYLELIIVIFRIAENLIKIRENLGSQQSGPAGPTGA